MLAWIYRWHRRLALGVTLFVLAWTLSGALHPIISRLSIPPQHPAPQFAAGDDAALLSARAILDAAQIHQAVHLRAFVALDTPVLQVQRQAGELPLYFDRRDGKPLADFAERWAVQLARDYLALGELPVRAVTIITGFNADYPAVNRYLPVVRVQFAREDGLAVAIDALSGRPAAVEHDQQKMLRKLFQWLHTFSFLPEPLRHVAATLLVTMAGATGVGGLILWGLQRRRPAVNRLRAWHRRFGVALSLMLIGFALSGGWHALLKVLRSPDPNWPVSTLHIAQLPADWPQAGPAVVWQALQQAGDRATPVLWRHALPASTAPLGAVDEHAHHRAATSGNATTPGDAGAMRVDASRAAQHERARAAAPIADRLQDGGGESRSLAELAGAQAARAGCQVQAVGDALLRFNDDYGFLNKRLPVWPVQCADGSLWFVDVRDGVLAARVTAADQIEGSVFDLLHKWRFLDPAGRDVRDSLLALAALLIATLAVIGVSMYAQRQRQRRARR